MEALPKRNHISLVFLLLRAGCTLHENIFAEHHPKQQIEILWFGEELWEEPFSNWHEIRENLVQAHVGLAAGRISSERGECTGCFLCRLSVSAEAPELAWAVWLESA